MSPEPARIDFATLRDLLAKETYPHTYTYKFIGKNSQRFTNGLHALEGKFPKLVIRGSRESTGGQNLAVSYALDAANADEIIDVLNEVTRVEDLLVIL